MPRAAAAMLLAVGLVLVAGVAAAQARLPDRSLPGSNATDKSEALRERTDRLPDRELPQLQNRGNDIGDPPPALRDRFGAFCKSRGGCPGGYAQHQAEFAVHEQEQRVQQREELERSLQQRQQQD